jgi:hypothetical protein
MEGSEPLHLTLRIRELSLAWSISLLRPAELSTCAPYPVLQNFQSPGVFCTEWVLLVMLLGSLFFV